jgi:hypothetical protein
MTAQQILFIFIQLAMDLNNYHSASKAYGSLKPENVLVFICNNPHGPLVYKLDKLMARKDAKIAGDLQNLGRIYYWLHMNGRQNLSGRELPISSEALSFPEDIFTDSYVVDIIQGLMRKDPISIDTVLKTKEMRAAYVAFMRQYGISEA